MKVNRNQIRVLCILILTCSILIIPSINYSIENNDFDYDENNTIHDLTSRIKLSSNPPNNAPNKNYFTYYKEITINHLKVSEDLTNFPLLISLYDVDLHTEVQADGDDIAFSNSTHWLNHEIELFKRDFNGTHARLVAWIRIPSLSSTIDTKIYMYYGNSTMKSRQDPNGVWSSDFKAVWHLNTTLLDSTSNGNNGTNYEANDGTAYIANGRDYDGIDDYSNMSSGTSIDNIFNEGASISAWIYPEGWGGNDYGRILAKSSVSSGSDGWAMCVDGELSSEADHHLLFFRGFNDSRGLWYTPEDSISLFQWQHVFVTYNDDSDSKVPSIYINGFLQSLTPEPSPSGSAVDDSSQPLYIGNYVGGDRAFDGMIDEVRLSKGIKSLGWIQTEYNNQGDPLSFYTVGSPEEIDLILPNITINSPNKNDLFGMEPPVFNVEINDSSDIDTMWYKLNNGTITTVNTDFSVNGSIIQTRWDEIGNGTLKIQFFANDSWGNIGFSEIMVRKDIISPTINVNTPDNLDLFGSTPPTFNVEIQDVSSVDSMWYTLNDGLNESFTVNGTISQTMWNECGNGSVSIKFYANDSLGNVDFSEVIVRKDIYNPIINIYAPELFDLCGQIAPNYSVSVTDPNGIDFMWYTLNDGLKTFFTANGTISQILWEGCEDGRLSIKFYANDTLGNEGFSEIVVQKGAISQTEFPWWLILIIAVPLGLALAIVGLKKSKKKEVQIVIIDKELDKLKQKRTLLDTEAKSAIKAYNYGKAAEFYEECVKISYQLYKEGDKLEEYRYKEYKSLELKARSNAEAIPLKYACINSLLTKFFDENGIKYYSNPQIYPENHGTINGLILNDDNLLQNRFTKLDDSLDLVKELQTDLTNLEHINAIQILYAIDLSVDAILDYCQKYQNPDMVLYIVGIKWPAYNYEETINLPKDSKIKYPENINIINVNLFYRIFLLSEQYQKEFQNIINLNDDLASLKEIYESTGIALHDTTELKDELKQKGLFFLI
ncbi:MAG: DUF2341 domain-containing protein [Candidatus Hodarchaeota archaeon]